MTTTARTESLSRWGERIYKLPLKKAQEIVAQSHENIVEEVGSVMDRTRVDRMLTMALLDRGDLSRGKWTVGATDETLLYAFHDLAIRLAEALEEVDRLVDAHEERDCARRIVEAARAEGRIPAKEAV